jgi:hypothetical protein
MQVDRSNFGTLDESFCAKQLAHNVFHKSSHSSTIVEHRRPPNHHRRLAAEISIDPTQFPEASPLLPLRFLGPSSGNHPPKAFLVGPKNGITTLGGARGAPLNFRVRISCWSQPTNSGSDSPSPNLFPSLLMYARMP